MSNTPLRITASLAEPFIYYGDGMHLDGLVALGFFRAMPREEQEALPPISSDDPTDFPLPLDRWEYGGAWGWKASAVHCTVLRASVYEVRKKTAVAQMARYTSSPSVEISGGHFKSTNVPFPQAFAHTLTWYAVGDLLEVGRLLALVHGVGKLCKGGCGRVIRWAVEEWPEDWSLLRGGALTRRMPWGFAPGIRRHGAIRTPYHHRSRVVDACEPVFSELRP